MHADLSQVVQPMHACSTNAMHWNNSMLHGWNLMFLLKLWSLDICSWLYILRILIWHWPTFCHDSKHLGDYTEGYKIGCFKLVAHISMRTIRFWNTHTFFFELIDSYTHSPCTVCYWALKAKVVDTQDTGRVDWLLTTVRRECSKAKIKGTTTWTTWRGKNSALTYAKKLYIV